LLGQGRATTICGQLGPEVAIATEPFLGGVHVQIIWRLPAEVLNHSDRVPRTHGPVRTNAESGEQGFAHGVAIACSGSKDIPNPVLEEASRSDPGLSLDLLGKVLVSDGGVVGLGGSLQGRSRLEHPRSQGVGR
jgi:hypothetical protein